MKMLRAGLFFVFYLLVILPTNLNAQTNSPIIGYDKVAWGATIQTVTQTYTGLKERNSEDASVGVKEYIQTNVGGGITERVFYFYENKLYRVFVAYNDIDVNTAKAIIDRLASIYGQIDNYDTGTQAQGGLMGKRTSLYWYYRNNLSITVNAVDFFNQYNYLVQSGVGVVYIDPTIQNKIDEAKTRERANKIQL